MSVTREEENNLNVKSVGESENGVRSEVPVGGSGDNQQFGDTTGNSSELEDEVTQDTSIQEEKLSKEYGSSEEINSITVSQSAGKQGNELPPQIHDRVAIDNNDYEEHDVVEIDLDDMGDDLDFGEIRKHCVEFGRASFNSDKKLNKSLISVDITDDKQSDKTKTLSKSGNDSNELVSDVSNSKYPSSVVITGDNKNDVLLEKKRESSESSHVSIPFNIFKKISFRRKSMPDTKLRLDDDMVESGNINSEGPYKLQLETAGTEAMQITRRRRSTSDVKGYREKEKLHVSFEDLLPAECNINKVPTKEVISIEASENQDLNEMNTEKIHLQNELKSKEKDNGFTFKNVDETSTENNQETPSGGNSSGSRERSRSTSDVMRSRSKINNLANASVTNMDHVRPRRKSTGDDYSDSQKTKSENEGHGGVVHTETADHELSSNLLKVHNNTRMRKKSDLGTIMETEKENTENSDSLSNYTKSRGRVDMENKFSDRNSVFDEADSNTLITKLGSEQEQKHPDVKIHDIADEIQRTSDGDEILTTLTSNSPLVGDPNMKSHGRQSESHALPLCYMYTEEEYLEESDDFALNDINDKKIHIQITDLDDDDIPNNGSCNAEFDFDDVDRQIEEAFNSIDNLSSGVSDAVSSSGSVRTRSSTGNFKMADDSPNEGTSVHREIIGRFNYPRMSVAEAEKMALKPYPHTGMDSEKLQRSENVLSYDDVKNISSEIEHNTDERSSIRPSLSRVDFGILKSVSRNIDLSKGSSRSVGHDSDLDSTLNRSRSNLISQSSDDIMNVRIYPPSEKWRILKNLIFISLAFMILFTAFNTTQTFQSSINSDRGLGSWSLVVYYFTLMVSNMFLPVIITKWLGCKGSMVVSCLLFAPYIVAQFYPAFYTLLPTSIAAGMGGGVLFCAQGTYASVMAETYMTVSAVDKETTMMLFFGIFFFLYLMSLVWGNLISAQVLLAGSASSKNHISTNLTKFCGANFCPDTPLTKTNVNLLRPPNDQLFIIWGILLALVFLAAAVLVIGVDSLSRYNETERAIKRGSSGCQLLAASVKHLGNPYQLLLIPVSALGSVSEGFLEADYTYDYIACAWGIPYIGYVIIGYGILLLLFTLLLGCFAVRIVGRLPLMVVCFILYLGVLAALKFWSPNPEESIVFFIIAGFWGIADASTVIITAMYGIVFLGNEEAAFCNLGISRALGYLLSYIMHPLLCMNIKLIIVLVIVLVAAAGYITFEHLWTKANKKDAMASLVPFKGWVDVPIKRKPRDEG